MERLDRVGRDILFYKIADKEFEEAKQLIESAVDVNFQDENGYSYLHCAAQVKSLEIAILLINKGAIIDIQDKYGKTPLMVAISGYNGDDTLIKFFLEHGASKELKNYHGVSAIMVAEMKGIDL
ncbi:ankyrin repeat domain-containing protein [Clostridium estertheticum]|uniref:ankyrin repeat domain-containing protein n=1 Tax=Clostridium estertheticum TaxID=238834 RepID=UPI001C7D02E7|nr:ankyrin repeat domain-containing protein [Clostridium estertheticum]MBX4262274.1 ankyrin repeat domain-containing protein [Clostridium estertheticum]WLC71998.1 ankyrin repeat domain-containing protein [Clostridium estertheticum]